jgi:sterol desaturase/sphingolipid hydroxylase (fatty acid hydroxylase superfamily)
MSIAASVTSGIQWLSDNTLAVILACTASAFFAEALFRRRNSRSKKKLKAANVTSAMAKRGIWLSTWSLNAILLIATLLVSLLLSPLIEPVLGAALRSQSGLLAVIEVPLLVRIVLGFFLLDLTMYALHWIAHRTDWLWRLHQVHHSDPAMNASTFFRQHPLTLVATLALQLPFLWLLGIPAASWALYTVVSAAVQIWHHSSAPTPAWIETAFGWWLVTPGMHRRHHHPDRATHDRNYGSVFSFWDSLFRTRIPALANDPASDAMTGLAYVPAKEGLSLVACLRAPFQSLKPAPSDVPNEYSPKKRIAAQGRKPTISPHRKTQ